MIQKKYIHGYYVQYESDDSSVSRGLDYLEYDLDKEEASVFFERAKTLSGKEVKFEDDREDQLSLVYDPYKSVFTLSKRS